MLPKPQSSDEDQLPRVSVARYLAAQDAAQGRKPRRSLADLRQAMDSSEDHIEGGGFRKRRRAEKPSKPAVLPPGA